MKHVFPLRHDEKPSTNAQSCCRAEQLLGIHEGPQQLALRADADPYTAALVPAPATPFPSGEMLYSKGAAVVASLEAYMERFAAGSFQVMCQAHSLPKSAILRRTRNLSAVTLYGCVCSRAMCRVQRVESRTLPVQPGNIHRGHNVQVGHKAAIDPCLPNARNK